MNGTEPLDDLAAMRLAIEASRNGFPAPNPRVGCAIVKDGVLLATGYHDHAGGPHAEIDALSKVNAEGATVYVTLEPCNGTGRTPPCSEALIKARPSRVVYLASDPNPKMAGGAARLREAGIPCSAISNSETLDLEVNRMWLTAMSMGRPFIALKAAASLDGRVALPSGESKWITNEDSRLSGHRWRAEYGAVLVGRNTVEKDNPQLTARIPGVVNQPTRIVIDKDNKIGLNYNCFDDSARFIHVVENPMTENQIGGKFVDGRLDLENLAKQLFGLGITSLLVEGGAKTLSAFVEARLYDRIHLFLAPKLLGSGPTWLENVGITNLADAPELSIKSQQRHGDDLELALEPTQVQNMRPKSKTI